jgi:hypothetical protein
VCARLGQLSWFWADNWYQELVRRGTVRVVPLTGGAAALAGGAAALARGCDAMKLQAVCQHVEVRGAVATVVRQRQRFGSLSGRA